MSWSELGFAQLQAALDEQSTQINASQEEGAASRRALTAQTKAFRKLSDEEKLGEMRSLLKNYQSEIDKLTSRCKFAESSFMDVYRSLALLPDPSAQLQTLQAENDQLKADNSKAQKAHATETSADNEQDSKLARELERQTLRVSQLERQLAKQKQKGTAGTANSTGSTGSTGTTSSAEDLENETMKWKAKHSRAEAEARQHSQQADKHFAELQKAKMHLSHQKDYEDLKSELQKLKASLGAADTSTSSGISSSTSTGNAGAGSSNEVVEMRRKYKQIEQELHTQQQLVATRDQEIINSKAMIHQLEDEMSGLQSGHNDTFSTISGWTAVPRNSQGTGTATTATMGAGAGDRSAVSGIIGQQRDRYKKRVQELEEQQHQHRAEMEKVKRELANITKDRQGLYERVRQLQVLVPNQAEISTPSTSARAATPSLYEPTSSAKLKELELDRRVQGLSPVNAKLVEFFARGMVDNNVRMGAAAYAAFVHLLAVYGLLT